MSCQIEKSQLKRNHNFSTELNLAPLEPIIFSRVSVESFDYGHGLGPVTSTTLPPRNMITDLPPVKVFDYSHKGGDRRDSPVRDHNFHQNRPRERPFYDYEPSIHERNRERDPDHRDRSRREINRDGRDRDLDREREKDRDFKRGREWDRRGRDDGEREKRSKWDSVENDRKDKSTYSSSLKRDSEDEDSLQSSSLGGPESDTAEITLIHDLLLPPKRESRPKQLVIILRGLPGSGKTYVAKLIKDKEIENGGSAPRILSLDDYFMTEVEVNDIDPDTGKRVKRKEFKYEYELQMEESYRCSLFKSFKKTIDDRFFPFIIVDAVHDKSKQYDQYWSYAKQRGFQVYIAEMDCSDPSICFSRNIHNRSLDEITKISKAWEKKPRHFMSIDVRSLLQDVAITEVEMEVEGEKVKEDPDEDSCSNGKEDCDTLSSLHVPSRWEKLEATEEKLDQLDGIRAGKKKHSSMEDYLQLPDDYEERKCQPGKKRVRWADLEERKEQDRLRAIGFVVGQTDWNKMTDPSHADRALTKTKYF